MDNKELISSVKRMLARLHSFGISREHLRNLLVLLFLLRWMLDEMASFADYNSETDSLKLAGRLRALFSSNASFHDINQHVDESIRLLRYSVNVEGLSDLDFSSKGHLFKDKKVVMEATHWFNQWGGLALDRRKDISRLFEVILQETRTPQTTLFSSSKLLSQLVVALAKPKVGETIFDPCVGEGNFLIEAHKVIESSDTDFLSHTSFTGYDLSEEAILISTVRFFLLGTYNFHLARQSGLYGAHEGERQKKYDVVLAQPPAGIKRNEYRHMGYDRNFPVITNDVVGMFIQQSLFALKEGGRAIIAIPEGLLFGNNRSQVELRRFLVEHGYVEAIVRIPPKVLIEDSVIRGALVILHKGKRNRKVRFADLSTYFQSARGITSQPLSKDLLHEILDRIFCEKLPEAIPLLSGVKDESVGTSVSTRAFWDVSYEEIRSNNWDLNPVRKVDDALNTLLSDFRKLIGDEVKVENLSKVAQINAGKKFKTVDQSDKENQYGYIRIRDISYFKVQNVTAWIREDMALVNSHNRLTNGNILISKTGTIGKLALIDENSDGTYAGSNFYVLRLNSAKVSPEYLLYYLSTSFCQDWLDSRKRGAVQQHINADVIRTLPILLPSIEMQKRAVSQYHQQRTDVITFLKENSQQSQHDSIERLIDVMELGISKLMVNDTPIEKSARLLSEISSVALSIDGVIEELNSQQKEWFVSVLSILRVLKDIHKIPPGPVLLNIFQEASDQITRLIESTPGNYNLEERLLRIFGYIKGNVERSIDKILANISIIASPSVKELKRNSDVEFSISIENQSFLPVKNMVVETSPDFGCGDTYYLADHTTMDMTLSGKTTDADIVNFTVMWRAETLVGKQVSGSSEIAIKLAQSTDDFKSLDAASNPYVTGSPLEPKNGALVFYGRDNLIQQIVRQIEAQGNVILLEGNRRAGKTSILKHLEGVDTIPNWLVVYCSLQGAEGASGAVGVPTAEVFREIARTIAAAITKLKIDVSLPDGKIILAGKPALGIARACKQGIGEDSPFIDFREYLEVILDILEEKDLGIVLMLDEFDKLQEGIDNDVTSPQVPENLRYLIQNYPRFSAVLTGSRRLKRLREEYWSALYGLGTNLAVTALDTGSAEKVVKEPVKDFIAFSNEAVALILELTAKQAYLIQKVCNRIFDYAATKGIHSIKSEDVLHIASELVKADEHFASLWDYAKLGPETGGYRRQALLYILAKNFRNETLCTFGMLQEELSQKGISTCDESLDADISYLRELELIKLCGGVGVGHYRLEIPLMVAWIEIHEDEEIVIKNAANEEVTRSDK